MLSFTIKQQKDLGHLPYQSTYRQRMFLVCGITAHILDRTLHRPRESHFRAVQSWQSKHKMTYKHKSPRFLYIAFTKCPRSFGKTWLTYAMCCIYGGHGWPRHFSFETWDFVIDTLLLDFILKSSSSCLQRSDFKTEGWNGKGKAQSTSSKVWNIVAIDGYHMYQYIMPK